MVLKHTDFTFHIICVCEKVLFISSSFYSVYLKSVTVFGTCMESVRLIYLCIEYSKRYVVSFHPYADE